MKTRALSIFNDPFDTGLSLRRRRAWAVDEGEPESPEKGTPETPTGAPSAETQKPDSAGQDTQEHMIPKSRLDQEIQRRKELEAKLGELEQARDEERKKQEKAEAERLKKQGEFEQLYTAEQAKTEKLEADLKSVNAELESLRDVFKQQLEKRLADVPAAIASLLEGKPALDAMQWLDEHAEEIKQPTKGAPSFGARDGLQSPKSREVTLNRPARL